MLQLIDKKKKIYFYIFFLILLSTPLNLKYDSFFKEVFKIKNIKIIPNEFVFEEVYNLLNQNIFKLNKSSLKNFLNKYTYLKSIEIKKIYPNSLEVLVTKSSPIAIINNQLSFTYLGDNGKVFKENKEYSSIPILKGDIDIPKAIVVLNLLNKSLYKLENIKEIIFFPTNRINIILNDSKILKFPINIDLKYINKTHNFLKTLKTEKKVIDFRILGKIILKNE
tara:strand:- start:1188 stop:1856 length:669 start_codon:yes stop_codon:yes gene_type:complete